MAGRASPCPPGSAFIALDLPLEENAVFGYAPVWALPSVCHCDVRLHPVIPFC